MDVCCQAKVWTVTAVGDRVTSRKRGRQQPQRSEARAGTSTPLPDAAGKAQVLYPDRDFVIQRCALRYGSLSLLV